MFIFTTKMATESAVTEIVWLTSAECGARAALNSDNSWQNTVTTSCAMAVPYVATWWRCHTAVNSCCSNDV